MSVFNFSMVSKSKCDLISVAKRRSGEFQNFNFLKK